MFVFEQPLFPSLCQFAQDPIGEQIIRVARQEVQPLFRRPHGHLRHQGLQVILVVACRAHGQGRLECPDLECERRRVGPALFSRLVDLLQPVFQLAAPRFVVELVLRLIWHCRFGRLASIALAVTTFRKDGFTLAARGSN